MHPSLRLAPDPARVLVDHVAAGLDAPALAALAGSRRRLRFRRHRALVTRSAAAAVREGIEPGAARARAVEVARRRAAASTLETEVRDALRRLDELHANPLPDAVAGDRVGGGASDLDPGTFDLLVADTLEALSQVIGPQPDGALVTRLVTRFVLHTRNVRLDGAAFTDGAIDGSLARAESESRRMVWARRDRSHEP